MLTKLNLQDKLAARMSRLGTETAFEVLAKAKALEAKGKHIVHLEIGEPDFDTPKNIVEAAKKALDDGYTHYNPSAGLPEFRDVIAETVSRTHGIKVKRENVVVTPGAKPIMWYTILALCEEGDEVLYPNPGFPIYESVINFTGATPVPIQLKEEKEFVFDIEDFKSKISEKTKLVILNSPQNPTGGVLEEEDLKQIAKIAKEHSFMILTDEVYKEILYDGNKFHSIASDPELQDRVIILDGFSKSYAMTGWRMGYGVMREDLVTLIAKLETNSDSCTCTFNQRACIEALTGPQDDVRQMVAEFEKRRNVIVKGLNEIPGITCRNPKGAFYVFPNITGTGKTAEWLADYLLNEAGVACLAGTCFGKFGTGYLRFSYANSVANIETALERIDKAVRRL
ncbi:MAG: pyridoxal phosphate-dependent aminotransferase [Cyanobacteriota bacterium]